MSILSWIILGLIVGFLASRLMGAGDYGLIALIGDILDLLTTRRYRFRKTRHR